MSELQGIGRFKFDEAGKLEEFKRLSAQAMEIVRAKDTGTLQYEIYFSDDQSECIVLERYKDSDALLEHAANLGELGAAIPATGLVSSELLGEPGAELRAKLADAPVLLFTPFLAMYAPSTPSCSPASCRGGTRPTATSRGTPLVYRWCGGGGFGGPYALARRRRGARGSGSRTGRVCGAPNRASQPDRSGGGLGQDAGGGVGGQASGSTLLGVGAWSRALSARPPLTPQAPSQKGWFRVRPQAHSAARVSASGPSGVSRTRSPRTSSGPRGSGVMTVGWGGSSGLSASRR